MLGLALQARGVPAVSLTANQCGIHTDGSFNKARVRAVETARLVHELGAGRVVIVAGFQGVTVNDDITTLGRGGGDITGAVLAAALQATSYENCTDVDGVYTADPRIVAEARRIPRPELRGMHRARGQRRQGAAPARGRDLHAVQRAHPCPPQFHRQGPGTWIREGAEMMETSVGRRRDDGPQDRQGHAARRPGSAGHRGARLPRSRRRRDQRAPDHPGRAVARSQPDHVRHRERRHRRGEDPDPGVEEEQDRRSRRNRHRRRQDRDRRLAHRLDAGPGGAHVHGARRHAASTSTASARRR